MGKRKRKQKSGMQGVRAAAPETCPPTPEFAAKNRMEKVKTDQGSYTLRVCDKRPIDKYHRLYRIDEDRGIGEYYRRGISVDQFRAADRLACNYERGFPTTSLSPDLVRVQSTVNVGLYPVESMLHAIHTHTRVMKELSRGSQEIVEDVCCKETCLSDYEHARGWRKGYTLTPATVELVVDPAEPPNILQHAERIREALLKDAEVGSTIINASKSDSATDIRLFIETDQPGFERKMRILSGESRDEVVERALDSHPDGIAAITRILDAHAPVGENGAPRDVEQAVRFLADAITTIQKRAAAMGLERHLGANLARLHGWARH